MEDIREQMALGDEISNAISNPVGMGQEFDEDELKAELDELEQETLDAQLEGARPVPMHSPTPATRIGALPCKFRLTMVCPNVAEIFLLSSCSNKDTRRRRRGRRVARTASGTGFVMQDSSTPGQPVAIA